MGACRQKHSSVGWPGTARGAGLNRSGGGSDPGPAELIEGLHEIPCPPGPQPSPDLLFEAVQPMALPGGGSPRRPPSVAQTLGEAVADLGNRCLESTPVTGGTHPHDHAANRTAVSWKPDRARAFVKPGRDEPMAPKRPPALRAHPFPRPLKAATQLKDPLDADVYEQYQGIGLCESYSLCSGGNGCLHHPLPRSRFDYPLPIVDII